jgi:hypothetical protein
MDKNDEILKYFLDLARGRQNCLNLGENISPIDEIKISFDGFAENPITGLLDEIDEESYAVLVNKKSGDKDYLFPKNVNSINFEEYPNTVCLYAWYQVQSEKWIFTNNLNFQDDLPISNKDLSKILVSLKNKYFIKKRSALSTSL